MCGPDIHSVKHEGQSAAVKHHADLQRQMLTAVNPVSYVRKELWTVTSSQLASPADF